MQPTVCWRVFSLGEHLPNMKLLTADFTQCARVCHSSGLSCASCACYALKQL